VSPLETYTPTEPSTSEMGGVYCIDVGLFEPTSPDQDYVIAGTSPLASDQWYVAGNGDNGMLRRRFVKLARQWEKETVNFSSVQQIVLNPNYQAIIGMGPKVIPLILKAMEESPGLWFWALISLTGEDPVSNEMRGDMTRMTETWLAWGKENAYR